MTNSIKKKKKKCISKFEQLEDDFMKEPTKLAEYVFGLTEYSCAMKSHFRKSGNQMSGKWKSSYASLLA